MANEGVKSIDRMREAASRVETAFAALASAEEATSGGPRSYYLKKLVEYGEALFQRFAPFRVGEWVSLRKQPATDNGWSPWKDNLVVGARGQIVAMDYADGVFQALVRFTFSDGAFYLSESFLRRDLGPCKRDGCANLEDPRFGGFCDGCAP